MAGRSPRLRILRGVSAARRARSPAVRQRVRCAESSVTAATAAVATGADGDGGVVLAANTPYESVLIDQESFHMESPPTPEEIRSSQRKLSSDFSVFKPTKSPQFSNKGLDIAGTTGSVTSDDSVKENTNRADRIAARLEAMRKL